MADLYETIFALCTQKGVTPSRMCLDIGTSKSLITELKAGRSKTLSSRNAQKIAEYFGVSVDYLLGAEPKETPVPTAEDRRKMTDGDIKYALFGNAEIDDDVLAEVRRFAKFAMEQKEQKKEID